MSPDTLCDLRGQIERVTYVNEEDNYSVLKVKVYGRRELVTVIGNIINPTPGEVIKMKGEWGNHPKFGEQFKLVFCQTTAPANRLRDRKIPGRRAGQRNRADHGQGDRQKVQGRYPGRDRKGN
jgi:hypothetical protein